MAPMNSVTNRSQVTQTIFQSGCCRQISRPTACSRWVLPRPDPAVDEQRVPLRGRGLGHHAGRGVGELVGGADHEPVEGVARVQAARRRARPLWPAARSAKSRPASAWSAACRSRSTGRHRPSGHQRAAVARRRSASPSRSRRRSGAGPGSPGPRGWRAGSYLRTTPCDSGSAPAGGCGPRLIPEALDRPQPLIPVRRLDLRFDGTDGFAPELNHVFHRFRHEKTAVIPMVSLPLSRIYQQPEGRLAWARISTETGPEVEARRCWEQPRHCLYQNAFRPSKRPQSAERKCLGSLRIFECIHRPEAAETRPH